MTGGVDDCGYTKLADQRDNLRATDPASPNIPHLNRKITSLVQEHRRKKWLEHLEKCNLRTGVKHLWRPIKQLTNSQKPTTNQPIFSTTMSPFTAPKLVTPNSTTNLRPQPAIALARNIEQLGVS